MANMVSTLKSLFFVVILFVGCSHVRCRESLTSKKDQSSLAQPDRSSLPSHSDFESSDSEKIRVYKYDGSLQCGKGKKIALTEMQKNLGAIKVYSSFNKSDGMIRIQRCGSPTGYSNVYEIDKKDLSGAQKAGFKVWSEDQNNL